MVGLTESWECPLGFRRVSDTLSLFDRVRKVEFWLLQHTETTISDDKRAEWPEAFDRCRVCKWGPCVACIEFQA